jgi:hypothetical protein
MKFKYDDMEIGEVELHDPQNRIIRFMPYRGPAHYRLVTELSEGPSCVCVLVDGGKTTNIIVTNYLGYGTVRYMHSSDNA